MVVSEVVLAAGVGLVVEEEVVLVVVRAAEEVSELAAVLDEEALVAGEVAEAEVEVAGQVVVLVRVEVLEPEVVPKEAAVLEEDLAKVAVWEVVVGEGLELELGLGLALE